MSIEVATYIADLQPVNPPATDPRGQGDDHLRLVKTVLQNQFPHATRPRPIETAQNLTVDYTIVSTDDQKTFYIDTTAGPVNLLLPALTAADAGWKCYYYKYSSDANPVFITVAAAAAFFSGGIVVTKARRCIPGIKLSLVWQGTTWFVERALSLPIGSLLDFQGANLPAGFEWPKGGSLSSATNYPEYFALNGSLVIFDVRGRTKVTLDNLGGAAAGRLAGGIITGTTPGNTGGTDTVSLGLAQIPTGIVSLSTGPVAISVISTNNDNLRATVHDNFTSVAGDNGPISHVTNGTVTSTGTIGAGSIGVTSSNTGGGAHSNLQPSIMVGQLLVVE